MYGDMTLLTGNSNRALAARISEALGVPLGDAGDEIVERTDAA